jgi:hypothetical protein
MLHSLTNIELIAEKAQLELETAELLIQIDNIKAAKKQKTLRIAAIDAELQSRLPVNPIPPTQIG